MRHYVILLLFFIFFLITISCSTENPSVYQLTTSSNPTEGGTVSPAEGDYDEGEEVSISATPNENWGFEQWQGDHSGSQNPATIVMDSDKNVTALFAKVNYPLIINTDGQGTVTEEIVQEKSTDYPHGAILKLTAEPAGGWQFDGWQGDIESTENPTMVTIQEETEITAVFTEIEYSLEVSVEGEGTVHEKVVQAKTDYPEGTVVELTAEPEEDWIFSEWSGGLEGSDNPGQITVDSPKEVTATFLRTYTLTTNVSPEEAGSVTPQSGLYVKDTTFEVEAIPASNGWTFVEWEGDFSGSVNPFSMTMNGNKTITANFEKRDFELNTTTEGEGGIEVTLISGKKDGEKYEYQTVLELLAIPEEGWSFLQWESENISETNPLHVEIDGDKSVIAVFRNKFYVAENGITIKCPNASVGEKSTINNVAYEAVDRELLDQRIEERADLTKVCTSLVTDMKNLLRDQPDFNQAIGNWDVSNVTDMSGMFSFADSFNSDISKWDVSSVTDMSGMFQGPDSTSPHSGRFFSSFDQDLSEWDVSNVTDMSRMFDNAISFNQDLNNWDVSNVTDMSGMFLLADNFNGDISSWDVSNVTDMSLMFVEGIFNRDISSWDVSNVTDMSKMFEVAYKFNQDIGEWDVGNVTKMSEMFSFAIVFNQDIAGWDVNNVTSMNRMFNFAESFNQDLSGWCVSNIDNEPTDFDTDASSWVLPKPIWGTCPD